MWRLELPARGFTNRIRRQAAPVVPGQPRLDGGDARRAERLEGGPLVARQPDEARRGAGRPAPHLRERLGVVGEDLQLGVDRGNEKADPVRPDEVEQRRHELGISGRGNAGGVVGRECGRGETVHVGHDDGSTARVKPRIGRRRGGSRAGRRS